MKINKFILACVAGLMLLSSCDDQENKVTYSGPSEVSFKTVEGTAIYGQSPEAGVDQTYNIEIGVTTTATTDRTVTVEVVPPANYKGVYDATMDYAKDDIMMLSSNKTYIANDVIPAGTALSIGVSGATWSEAGVAIEGHHYNVAKTVVIPAGEYVGNCVVTPVFANLVSAFMDFELKITAATDANVATYRTNITNKVIKFIPFDAAQVVGTYVAEYGYDVEVVEADKAGEYLLKGEAADGDIRFKFVYTNPADFHTIVLAESNGLVWYTHSTYGDVIINAAGAKGEFSMAGPSFSVVFNGVVAAGVFRNTGTSFVKK